MIPEELVGRAKTFTDSGNWKSSWHWERSQHGSLTRTGAEQMLADLGCNDEAAEIHEAIAAIRSRYALADEIRQHLDDEECYWPTLKVLRGQVIPL